MDPMQWVERQALTLQVMPACFRRCAVQCAARSAPPSPSRREKSSMSGVPRRAGLYVQQHLRSQIPVRNMALPRTQQEAVVPAEECHGLNLLDPPSHPMQSSSTCGLPTRTPAGLVSGSTDTGKQLRPESTAQGMRTGSPERMPVSEVSVAG